MSFGMYCKVHNNYGMSKSTLIPKETWISKILLFFLCWKFGEVVGYDMEDLRFGTIDNVSF